MENKSSLKYVRKLSNEYGLFYPINIWDKDATLDYIKSTSTTKET